MSVSPDGHARGGWYGVDPFDVGGTPVPVPHWSLHVWLHETNPNGLFVPFNPAVVFP